MKQGKDHIQNAIGALERRRRLAREPFVNFCEKTRLVQTIGQERWAIVGGAIRDTLLSEHPSQLRLFPGWPDLDIAVLRDADSGRAGDSVVRKEVIIRRNRFGGVKAREATIGAMDVWVWNARHFGEEANQVWKKQLGLVDFGINAVAFVWPECEVILHPQWESDLEAQRVEKLTLSPAGRRELQPVRAIALATKLRQMLGVKFAFGRNAKADLRWFCEEASYTEVVGSLAYLKSKVEERRWPADAARRVGEEALRFSLSDGFLAALRNSHLLSVDDFYALKAKGQERIGRTG